MTMQEEQFIDMPDGRKLTIAPLTFGRARICIGPDEMFVETGY